MSDSTTCSTCGSNAPKNDYELALHSENCHSGKVSPSFVVEEEVHCPYEGCSETIPECVLAVHLQIHEIEAITAAEESRQRSRHRSSSSGQGAEKSNMGATSDHRRAEHIGTARVWRSIFEGRSKTRKSTESSKRPRRKSNDVRQQPHPTVSPKSAIVPAEPKEKANQSEKKREFNRLGKSELGKFAHEDEMPNWLIDLLREQGQVVNKGLIPVLGQLLDQNPSTEYAYVCHPAVQHISKLRREGGFCGYRNIQMLCSNVVGAKLEGSQQFGDTFPDIFQIQDLIENAWDRGFNPQGRVETGGIRGTRKYIGTPEAQALFCSLGVPCSVRAFKHAEDRQARKLLFEAIESYFRTDIAIDTNSKVHYTTLPPIYFQHPGHSLTIVGTEKSLDGQINLLVFDPKYQDAVNIMHVVGKIFRHKSTAADEALEPYRRGAKYLRKFNQFEVLFLQDRT